MKYLLIGLAALLYISTSVIAQVPSIGIKGGYLYVMNTSTIPIIPGSTDCGTFSNGVAHGLFAGLTGEYSLFGDALEGTAAIVYSQRPADLTMTSDDDFEVLDPLTNTYLPFDRLHRFSSSLGYVSIEVGFRSRPIDFLPLYIRAAFDAGNPLVNGNYEQTEEISSPGTVLFPDNTRRHVTAAGEFPQLSTSYGASGFLGAVVPLSANIELCPEVGFRYGINSVSKAATWKQSYILAGVQLRYRMRDDVPPPTPPPPPPQVEPPPPAVVVVPVPVPPPVVITSITTTPLEIRETVVTQTFPLLPYIFFDSTQATMRSRYVQTSDRNMFSENSLPKQTLQIYYNLLDVVGRRLIDKPDATLVVTGTTDGRELTSASERRELAGRRADVIIEYLSNRWSLPASRFAKRVVETPSYPTNDRYIEGLEENRRVEISSSDASILGPIIHTRFKEFVPVQSKHVFSVQTRNPERSATWNMNVTRNGQNIGQKTAPGIPPAQVEFDLTQDMTNRLGPVVGNVDSLDASVRISQTSGDDVTGGTRFPLRKTVSNFEVSRLSLIVFDFDQSGITDANKAMMKRVIAASANNGSTATIKGSTDRLGELAHNMELSTARAHSVEQYIRTVAPGVRIESVEGLGPSELPYDNSLPEGRFYCRTVSLTITTPLREQ
ncbi:MAG: OmpA family protein [bacterium]|nr:OmpA family protein [bacterium]